MKEQEIKGTLQIQTEVDTLKEMLLTEMNGYQEKLNLAFGKPVDVVEYINNIPVEGISKYQWSLLDGCRKTVVAIRRCLTIAEELLDGYNVEKQLLVKEYKRQLTSLDLERRAGMYDHIIEVAKAAGNMEFLVEKIMNIESGAEETDYSIYHEFAKTFPNRLKDLLTNPYLKITLRVASSTFSDFTDISKCELVELTANEWNPVIESAKQFEASYVNENGKFYLYIQANKMDEFDNHMRVNYNMVLEYTYEEETR